jgi:outer membrane protein TolC
LQPNFDAGSNRRRLEVAESRQRQTLHAYERAVLLAFRELEDVLAGLRQAALRSASEGERVVAERKMRQLAELRYRGSVAYLGVLDAQRSLVSAELDESAAARDELVAVVQLYETLGDAWTEPDQWRPRRGR